MTVEQFELACKSLKPYFGTVGVFGGSPCLHKEFAEICKVMRRYIPYHRRGIWANALHGKGAICAKTFNPAVSNLNCHMQGDAYDEFCRDWPAAKSHLKGMDCDSTHGPVMVAMKDLEELAGDEGRRWELISACEINRNWSAMIAPVRGEVRGFFCEVAGAQAIWHQNDDPEQWPDLGKDVKADPYWWRKGMESFEQQACHYCHRCAVPLKAPPALALSGLGEKTSPTHANVFVPKDRTRPVEVVTSLVQLGGVRETGATKYLPTETDYGAT